MHTLSFVLIVFFQTVAIAGAALAVIMVPVFILSAIIVYGWKALKFIGHQINLIADDMSYRPQPVRVRLHSGPHKGHSYGPQDFHKANLNGREF